MRRPTRSTHAPHPGQVLLEEHLDPLDMTQSELASKMGVPFPRVNEIIRGRRGITADTALRLEQVLGVPAERWMDLQKAWELDEARIEQERRNSLGGRGGRGRGGAERGRRGDPVRRPAAPESAAPQVAAVPAAPAPAVPAAPAPPAPLAVPAAPQVAAAPAGPEAPASPAPAPAAPQVASAPAPPAPPAAPPAAPAPAPGPDDEGEPQLSLI